MLKNLFEWKRDQNYIIDKLNHSQPTELRTAFDEDLIQDQINDWITRLVGLCHEVPNEDRPELAEQITKVIYARLTK